MQQHVVVQSGDYALAGILRTPEKSKMPCIVLCHGFRETKDSQLMLDLAMELTYAGFATLAFDFSGHGESQGSIELLTVSQELKDIEQVFAFAEQLPQIDRIALVGHSLGAMLVLLFAARQFRKKTAAVAALAPFSDFQKLWKSFLNEDELLAWRKGGETLVHGTKFRSGLLLDSEQYHLAPEDIQCPVLLIHGTEDRRVPLQESKIILNALQCQKGISIIDNADHSFTDNTLRKQMIAGLVQWLKVVLR